MAYVIAEPCIAPKTAQRRPSGGLHPKKDDPKFATEELIYIDPVNVSTAGPGSGGPVSAIFALDDLPEKWSDFA